MKKLIRNPFFIAAILLTLVGIITLVIYLTKKNKKQLKQPIPTDSSGAINNPVPSVKVPQDESIQLTTPFQRSSKIKKLQKGLNKRGYNLVEDGIYGELTHKAALNAYPNFLSDGQISPDELITILDAASEYNSSFAWTRPAISKTGESIASIIGGISMDLSYEATKDAKLIHDSLSWFNDDEQAIKKVLYRLSKAQIAQLLVSFQALYGQSLDDYLKGGLLWGLDDTEYDQVLAIVRARSLN